MHRAWFLLALAILAFSGGMVSGWWILIRIGYVLLASILLAFVWGRLNLWEVSFERRPRALRAAVGERFQERLVLRNRGLLPKLWVEVHDFSTLPGHEASCVLTLGGKRSRAWTVVTPCRVRGEYLLGPVMLVTGDPFGLFTFTKTAVPPNTVTIYPRVEPLPGLALPSGDIARESPVTRRSEHSTPRVAGVREYSPGDAFSRIHWPSTARSLRLMVKEFEEDPSADIWIVVDADPAVQFGEGEDSTLELVATLAASIAAHYLERDLAVGLAAAGDVPYVLHADRGHRQYIRTLEWLARLDAVSHYSIAEVLAGEARRFTRNTTLFVVTPSNSEDWAVVLRDLTRRGVRGNAVVIDASSFGSRQSPLVLVGDLAASRIPTVIAHHGEPLGEVVVFSEWTSGRR